MKKLFFKKIYVKIHREIHENVEKKKSTLNKKKRK